MTDKPIEDQAATIARLESDIAQLGQVIEAGVERERAADATIAELRERLREAEKQFDNFSEAQLKERKTGEQYQRELRTALQRIATGDGYYGAQAREYKNIARSALGMRLI